MENDDKKIMDETLDSVPEIENNKSDSTQPVGTPTSTMNESLQAQLDLALKERQEYLDGWQRLKADVANLRKSESQRLAWAEAAGKESVFEAILPALDGFEMATKSSSWATVDQAWRSGIEGVYAQLQSALVQAGAQKYGTIGETFDPALHEPVGTTETTDPDADGKITEVMGVGWKLADKILRPARVKIAHKSD